jgi:hypothetical protein
MERFIVDARAFLWMTVDEVAENVFQTAQLHHGQILDAERLRSDATRCCRARWQTARRACVSPRSRRTCWDPFIEHFTAMKLEEAQAYRAWLDEHPEVSPGPGDRPGEFSNYFEWA